MSEALKQITVETFLIEQEAKLPRILDYIEKTPVTYDEKVHELLKLIKMGVVFGLEKGATIERWAKETIRKANAKTEERWIREFISEYNESGIDQKIKK